MAIKFTDEQQSVIEARDSNVLVSAAAGSGKTAVLVERIIQIIKSGVDIDHLLVVTFTKAAASQMKEKITAAIQKNLSLNPEDKHLQRQETLIHNAQITTIDAFCQYVVKNNFNAIGIDPSFRIGDEGELKLVQDEVMQNMLEEEYAHAKEGGNDDFLYCMDYFGVGNSDKAAEEYIMQLYDFSMSMPWPEDFINERARDYDCEGDFDSLSFVKACVESVKRILKESRDSLLIAEKICCESDGPYMYGDNLQDEIDQFEACLNKNTYDELFDAVRSIDFKRLSGKKDDSVSPSKKELVKSIRDEVKEKKLKPLKENYLYLPAEAVASQMKLCSRAVKELCRLTLRFRELYDEDKKSRQLMDFSDLEHYALRILVDHPDKPTATALEYRSYYKEVLIDEYQDSNNVQELILKSISGEIADISERFMVGDVKQSIYRFRLARPEIFMEKLGSYSKDAASKDRRIDLHKNFRSRREVLDITNFMFEKLMGSDLGGVDYDEDAKLVYGAEEIYKEPSFDVTPEFLLIDNSDRSALGGQFDDSEDGAEEQEKDSYDFSDFDSYSAKEKEALAIAERIQELMQSNKDLRFKDIVILLRSPSGWDECFKNVLESQQIPAYVETKTGYFEAYEVAVMMNLLQVIDNPSLDIPMVSVMHSAIGGFSDEEMARLKIMTEKSERAKEADSRYRAFCCLLEENRETKGDEALEGLLHKLSGFIDFLENLREISVYTPVHELLELIIDETSFDSYILALPGGNQRKANLDQLLSRAVTFEKSSFKGLFHFVRYIDRIKMIQVDYGEAGIIDENADVVRIMSIHKSKGLEFPVVFVAGMAKKFNLLDTRRDLICDMDMGIGVKCVDLENRLKFDTLRRVLIADKMQRDSMGEELRVLYVALTRAKEKLIMTAGVKNLQSMLQRAARNELLRAGEGKLLPFSARLNAKSYYEWAMYSLVTHPAFKAVVKELEQDFGPMDLSFTTTPDAPPLSIEVLTADSLKKKMLINSTKGILRQNKLANELESEFDPELAGRLKEKFASIYAYENLKGLYTKTTVTELKKHLLEEMGEVFTKPLEYSKEPQGLSGADRGTAYHRIMEILDDNIWGKDALSEDEITSFISDKAKAGVIPKDYPPTVKAGDVATFLSSSLGKRMAKAFRGGVLMREKPFMMGIAASELNDRFPKEEKILIQGIVDAWFFEGDDIILMDYKTDRVEKEQELVDRYKIQLDYYKRALEAATGKKVKEIYIYSFHFGSVIPVPLM